ncbi:MAG: ABC transporter ATP-binding protein [Hyphomicrobiales bacterium]|nr:ABC transporter ATP-binding protein [Hyphomicrobiales bacterium]
MKHSPVIEIEHLSKSFGAGEARVTALADVDVTISTGEVVGLIGPSGSGKSTLLNCIGCIAEPDSGLIRLSGREIYSNGYKTSDLRRLRLELIGFIFQSHNLLPFMPAWENVALVCAMLGQSMTEARDRAMELLDYLDVSRRAKAYPSELSGGEAQRVAIARALANRPKIILADEPTAALDSERASIVMDLLRRVSREQDTAIVVVSHDEKVFSRFDRMLHLRDGRLELGA